MDTFKFKVNGNSYEVNVKDFEDNKANIEVNGTEYNVELDKDMVANKPKPVNRAKKTVAANDNTQSAPAPSSSGGGKIISPLPGSIIEINIAVGDAVKHGQKLIIMEAMKMENDVLSDIEGVVSAIKVKVGDSVLQSDTLVEIS